MRWNHRATRIFNENPEREQELPVFSGQYYNIMKFGLPYLVDMLSGKLSVWGKPEKNLLLDVWMCVEETAKLTIGCEESVETLADQITKEDIEDAIGLLADVFGATTGQR